MRSSIDSLQINNLLYRPSLLYYLKDKDKQSRGNRDCEAPLWFGCWLCKWIRESRTVKMTQTDLDVSQRPLPLRETNQAPDCGSTEHNKYTG